MRRCIGRENSSSAIDSVSWRKSEKLFKSNLLRYIKYGAIYLCVKTIEMSRCSSVHLTVAATNRDEYGCVGGMAGEINGGGGEMRLKFIK